MFLTEVTILDYDSLWQNLSQESHDCRSVYFVGVYDIFRMGIRLGTNLIHPRSEKGNIHLPTSSTSPQKGQSVEYISYRTDRIPDIGQIRYVIIFILRSEENMENIFPLPFVSPLKRSTFRITVTFIKYLCCVRFSSNSAYSNQTALGLG